MRAVAFFLLSLLGRLPLSLRRFFGRRLGGMLRLLARRRAKIAARNLQLALPELSARERGRLLRAHFCRFGEALMDELWLLSAPPEKLRDFVLLENPGALARGRGALLLMPHFAGMNIAGAAINDAAGGDVMALYRPMRMQFWEKFFLQLRRRPGAIIVSAKEKNALRKCVSHLRAGGKLIYLPDMDAKRGKHSVFAPFLGVQKAATFGSVGKMARAGRADVLPCIVRMTGDGYRVRFLPPMECDGENPAREAATMNRLIGEHVRETPAAYYWLHRRFKTRPEGEANPYD